MSKGLEYVGMKLEGQDMGWWVRLKLSQVEEGIGICEDKCGRAVSGSCV